MWIKEYIELEREREKVQEELSPLQAKMHSLNAQISKLNGDMPYGVKKLITEKLWENITPSEKEEIEDYHRKVSEMMDAGYSTISARNCPFDPRLDKWSLITFEEKDGKIRFEVSCKRNEGTISGLMTFLDPYWTTWFDISELENI